MNVGRRFELLWTGRKTAFGASLRRCIRSSLPFIQDLFCKELFTDEELIEGIFVMKWEELSDLGAL